MFVSIFFLLVLGATYSVDQYGVDVSSLISTKSFECLKTNYSFAVVRCYRSVGSVDENCPQTIRNAYAAGLDPSKVHAYLFPCPTCRSKNATAQVDEMMDFFAKESIKVPIVWLDLEGGDLYWWDDVTKNQKFFLEMCQELKNRGQRFGCYASHHSYPPIFGIDWPGGSQQCGDLLWYAHYDNLPEFSDWYKFGAYGGWTKPFVKQFKGTTDVCDAGIDKDWTPYEFN